MTNRADNPEQAYMPPAATRAMRIAADLARTSAWAARLTTPTPPVAPGLATRVLRRFAALSGSNGWIARLVQTHTPRPSRAYAGSLTLVARIARALDEQGSGVGGAVAARSLPFVRGLQHSQVAGVRGQGAEGRNTAAPRVAPLLTLQRALAQTHDVSVRARGLQESGVRRQAFEPPIVAGGRIAPLFPRQRALDQTQNTVAPDAYAPRSAPPLTRQWAFNQPHAAALRAPFAPLLMRQRALNQTHDGAAPFAPHIAPLITLQRVLDQTPAAAAPAPFAPPVAPLLTLQRALVPTHDVATPAPGSQKSGVRSQESAGRAAGGARSLPFVRGLQRSQGSGVRGQGAGGGDTAAAPLLAPLLALHRKFDQTPAAAAPAPFAPPLAPLLALHRKFDQTPAAAAPAPFAPPVAPLLTLQRAFVQPQDVAAPAPFAPPVAPLLTLQRVFNQPQNVAAPDSYTPPVAPLLTLQRARAVRQASFVLARGSHEPGARSQEPGARSQAFAPRGIAGGRVAPLFTLHRALDQTPAAAAPAPFAPPVAPLLTLQRAFVQPQDGAAPAPGSQESGVRSQESAGRAAGGARSLTFVRGLQRSQGSGVRGQESGVGDTAAPLLAPLLTRQRPTNEQRTNAERAAPLLAPLLTLQRALDQTQDVAAPFPPRSAPLLTLQRALDQTHTTVAPEAYAPHSAPLLTRQRAFNQTHDVATPFPPRITPLLTLQRALNQTQDAFVRARGSQEAGVRGQASGVRRQVFEPRIIAGERVAPLLTLHRALAPLAQGAGVRGQGSGVEDTAAPMLTLQRALDQTHTTVAPETYAPRIAPLLTRQRVFNQQQDGATPFAPPVAPLLTLHRALAPTHAAPAPAPRSQGSGVRGQGSGGQVAGAARGLPFVRGLQRFQGSEVRGQGAGVGDVAAARGLPFVGGLQRALDQTHTAAAPRPFVPPATSSGQTALVGASLRRMLPVVLTTPLLQRLETATGDPRPTISNVPFVRGLEQPTGLSASLPGALIGSPHAIRHDLPGMSNSAQLSRATEPRIEQTLLRTRAADPMTATLSAFAGRDERQEPSVVRPILPLQHRVAPAYADNRAALDARRAPTSGAAAPLLRRRSARADADAPPQHTLMRHVATATVPGVPPSFVLRQTETDVAPLNRSAQRPHATPTAFLRSLLGAGQPTTDSGQQAYPDRPGGERRAAGGTIPQGILPGGTSGAGTAAIARAPLSLAARQPPLAVLLAQRRGADVADARAETRAAQVGFSTLSEAIRHAGAASSAPPNDRLLQSWPGVVRRMSRTASDAIAVQPPTDDGRANGGRSSLVVGRWSADTQPGRSTATLRRTPALGVLNMAAPSLFRLGAPQSATPAGRTNDWQTAGGGRRAAAATGAAFLSQLGSGRLTTDPGQMAQPDDSVMSGRSSLVARQASPPSAGLLHRHMQPRSGTPLQASPVLPARDAGGDLVIPARNVSPIARRAQRSGAPSPTAPLALATVQRLFAAPAFPRRAAASGAPAARQSAAPMLPLLRIAAASAGDAAPGRALRLAIVPAATHSGVAPRTAFAALPFGAAQPSAGRATPGSPFAAHLGAQHAATGLAQRASLAWLTQRTNVGAPVGAGEPAAALPSAPHEMTLPTLQRAWGAGAADERPAPIVSSFAAHLGAQHAATGVAQRASFAWLARRANAFAPARAGEPAAAPLPAPHEMTLPTLQRAWDAGAAEEHPMAHSATQAAPPALRAAAALDLLRPHSSTLQRFDESTAPPPSVAPAAEAALAPPAAPDIEALARQVYARLRLRLMVDAERLGR